MWKDEIVVGCLRAFGELKNPALVTTIKKYASEACNQNVVAAALNAWADCAPNDKELYKTLIAAMQSPVYALQQSAITMLGRLSVSDAVPALKEILAQNADANLIVRREERWREFSVWQSRSDGGFSYLDDSVRRNASDECSASILLIFRMNALSFSTYEALQFGTT